MSWSSFRRSLIPSNAKSRGAIFPRDSKVIPVGGQPVHPLPREAILLATPPKRAQPNTLHIVVECFQRSSVSASDDPLDPMLDGLLDILLVPALAANSQGFLELDARTILDLLFDESSGELLEQIHSEPTSGQCPFFCFIPHVWIAD